MGRKWSQTFVVEGMSSFPIDMLRYDHCWPSTSEDASTITELLAHKFVQKSDKGPQRVTLQRDSELKHTQPTEARWKSFGWTVVPNSVFRV
jgi:hypothetical protein